MTNIFRVNRGGYVSPKEALSADPAAIMQTLKYVDHIDEKKMDTLLKDRPDGSSVASGSLDLGDASLSGVVNSDTANAAAAAAASVAALRRKKTAEPVDDVSVIPESIGDSVVPLERQQKRHGYGPNEPLQEGDLLPTGHAVKPAYPKSIAQQIEVCLRCCAMLSLIVCFSRRATSSRRCGRSSGRCCGKPTGGTRKGPKWPSPRISDVKVDLFLL